MSETLSSSGAPDTIPDTTSDLPAWDEPKTLDDLTNMYVVENKIAGRSAGTTLYLVQAKSRSGQARDVEENVEFKLFLAHALAISKFTFAHSPFPT